MTLERALLGGSASLILAATWGWGGLHHVWLTLMVILSAILCASFFLWPLAAGSMVRRACRRDPFFWAGLLFLAYLSLQWWNAGRVLYFDVEMKRWVYTPPPHPGWPWAFNRSEAMQMLQWFFPAWTLGLIVRSPAVSQQGLSKLFRNLMYGAGLLAVVGLLQYVTHASRQFWLVPAQGPFFASFAYANHAAAYFVLMGAVTAGFLFREAFRPNSGRSAHRVGGLTVILGLCLLGANLSLSRAGVILAWGLASLVALYGFATGWKRLGPLGKANLLLAVGCAGGMFFFAVSGLGRTAIRQQFTVRQAQVHPLIPILPRLNLDLGDRPVLARAAVDVWRAHPWLGTGGWGFRYLAAHHLPETRWPLLRRNAGWANVHNDPLQYLAEFGLVGGGLMTLALGALIVPLTSRRRVRGAVFTLGCTGLGLVVVFSLIDLPFRCPAILWTWVTTLAALPKLCTPLSVTQRTSSGNLPSAVPALYP